MTGWASILLGNTLLAGTLAMAAVMVMRLRRPAIAHALWLLVLVKLITPPMWEVGVPVPDWESEEPAAIAQTPLAPELTAPSRQRSIPSPSTLGEGQGEGLEEAGLTQVVAEPSPTPLPAYRARVWKWNPPTPAQVIMGTWLTGSLLWLTLLAIRIHRFNRLSKRSTPAPDELQHRANLLARSLGLASSPTVELLPAAISPMLWLDGRSARLLIPQQLLENLDPEQRDALLLHELAHLKRKDHLTRLLEILVTAIFWWHPLVWIARKGLREAEEQCCDAWVIWAMPDSARRYADALVDTLDFLAASPHSLPPAASGLGGLHHLQRRLTMIFTHTPPRTLSWTGRIVVLGLVGLLPLRPVWSQPTQPAANPEPSFGPVINREIPGEFNEMSVIDFESGNVQAWPVEWRRNLAPARGEREWLQSEAVDAYPLRGELQGNGLVAVPARAGFDAATASQARDAVRAVVWSQDTTLAPTEGALPKTYFFRTKSGNIGILEILVASTPSRVKIRYRMVAGSGVTSTVDTRTNTLVITDASKGTVQLIQLPNPVEPGAPAAARELVPATGPAEGAVPASAARRELISHVLLRTAQVDGVFTAQFLSAEDGLARTLRVGDRIAGGQITGIDNRGVEFRADGAASATRVEALADLTGRRVRVELSGRGNEDIDFQLPIAESRPTADVPVPAPNAATSETRPLFFIVTGIVNEDGIFHAYVENVVRGGLTRVKAGDRVANGVVQEIRLTEMLFQPDGAENPTAVAVGQTLEGRAIESVEAYRQQIRTARSRASGRGQNPGRIVLPDLDRNDQLSIEERMRLRRDAALAQRAVEPQEAQAPVLDRFGQQPFPAQGGTGRRFGQQPAAAAAAPPAPDREVVMALLEAMADTDQYVQSNAQRSLAAMGVAALPTFIEAASNPSAATRANAMQMLQAVLLRYSPYQMQMGAIYGGGGGRGRGGRGGARGGGGGFAGGWNQATGLLVASPDQQAIELQARIAPVAIKAMEDADLNTRLIAAAILGLTIDQIDLALPVLARALESTDAMVRKAALASVHNIALYRGGEKIAPHLPVILKQLIDPDQEIRLATIALLGQLGPSAKSAAPELLKALKDEDPTIRAAAAEALGRIQAPLSPVPAAEPVDDF